MKEERIVTVFGSARVAPGHSAYEAAHELGRLLAREGFALCNGGYGGIMEASARGARAAGGRTIGVTVRGFGRTPNAWLQTVIEEESLLTRMKKLLDLGSAYVLLPGGTGTLLELAAVWEFINKGLLPVRPVVALGPFWRPVRDLIGEQLRAEGYEKGAGIIRVEPDAAACVSYLKDELARD